MKIKALIEHLQTLDPELDVILAMDSEGNDYHDLAAFGGGVWDRENQVFSPYTDEDAEDESGRVLPQRILSQDEWNTIVLWP
jgi:hypothetical protein